MAEDTIRRYDVRRGDYARDEPTPDPHPLGAFLQALQRELAFARPGVTAGVMTGSAAPAYRKVFPDLAKFFDEAPEIVRAVWARAKTPKGFVRAVQRGHGETGLSSKNPSQVNIWFNPY